MGRDDLSRNRRKSFWLSTLSRGIHKWLGNLADQIGFGFIALKAGVFLAVVVIQLAGSIEIIPLDEQFDGRRIGLGRFECGLESLRRIFSAVHRDELHISNDAG